jgi:hypothetical protein
MINQWSYKIAEKVWNPLLFAIICNLIAVGFLFYNIMNTGTLWFNGISIESIGFLISGFFSFYLYLISFRCGMSI